MQDPTTIFNYGCSIVIIDDQLIFIIIDICIIIFEILTFQKKNTCWENTFGIVCLHEAGVQIFLINYCQREAITGKPSN